jgi:hypothetical protein
VNAALDRLLDQGRLWRGHTQRQTHALSTGHPALDAALPGGGWPRGALSEVLHAAPGSGELHLIMPLLAHLSRQGRPVALISPPLIPYAPGWAQAGVDLARLVVIEAPPARVIDSACQLLQAGAAAVCLWPRRLSDTDTRRLTLAAETAQAFALWMRPVSNRDTAATAALSVAVQGNRADLLKVRGGRPRQGCALAA